MFQDLSAEKVHDDVIYEEIFLQVWTIGVGLNGDEYLKKITRICFVNHEYMVARPNLICGQFSLNHQASSNTGIDDLAAHF